MNKQVFDATPDVCPTCHKLVDGCDGHLDVVTEDICMCVDRDELRNALADYGTRPWSRSDYWTVLRSLITFS